MTAGRSSRRRSASTITAPSITNGHSFRAVPSPSSTPPTAQRLRWKARSAATEVSTGHRSQLIRAVAATAGETASAAVWTVEVPMAATITTTASHTSSSSAALRSK